MTDTTHRPPARSTAPTVSYETLDPDQVLAQLQSSLRGLTAEERAQRLTRYGPNVIVKERGTPLWRAFVANLTNFFAVLLWGAAALSFLTGGSETGIAIIVVILINAVFSFAQEYRAEQAIAALQKLLPANANVRCAGEVVQVPAATLVPGDILVLDAGDNISTDARLLHEFDLRANQATLTGESEPVRKTADLVAGAPLTWTQLPNLVFAGTSVASGMGDAVVFATGMQTAFGQIAHLTQSVKADRSPLQIQLGRIARTVVQLSVVMGSVFFIVGRFFAQLSWRDGAIFAIGIVIANVPEGLLPTLSLALASGAQRLARRHALVKRLSSVETLGSATVICTDKTSTLTQNEMTVREAWVSGHALQVTGVGYTPDGAFVEDTRPITTADVPDLGWLVRAAAACNNARLLPPNGDQPHWRILGDPTEGALLVAAAKAGEDDRLGPAALPQLAQLPFDSRRKRMSVLVQPTEAVLDLPPRTILIFTKGAPNEILACCTHIRDAAGVRALTAGDRQAISDTNDQYARSGLRVLAFATRGLPAMPAELIAEAIERELTFIGLMAMHDPPRPEVADAVARAQAAGIRIVMITGDYGLTAEAIARKIGIIRSDTPRILTGAELDALDDTTLRRLLHDEPEVLCARVAPEHKLRIVEAFQALGATVAVTGDGVNDAPALKRADIGVAMGRSGTDVAKEAAAMILTDDNFASIVAAVEEGRAVFDNIRKFVTYIFAHLAGEAVPYLCFALFNLPLPLTVLQILAIDLGTDTLPALALGTEKPEPDVMARPPRPRAERLLNGPTLFRSYFYLGLLLAVGEMVAYFWQLTRRGWHWGITGANPLFTPGSLYQREAATMVFLGIVVMQIANVFACRTERASVFQVGLWSNRLILIGIGFELLVAAALIYIPFFQPIVGTAPIDLSGWLIVLAFTPLVFGIEELRKWLVRRWKGQHAPQPAHPAATAPEGRRTQ